jgi:CheY-like chemotaxis protein
MKTIKSIVLIDDNKIDCFINQKIIDFIHDHQSLKIFNSGIQALDYFNEVLNDDGSSPILSTDLILLDINMPVINGFEFIERLALTPTFKENPIDIYFLSSSNNESDITKALAHKYCSGYILKPLTKDKLINAIQSKTKYGLELLHDNSLIKKENLKSVS